MRVLCVAEKPSIAKSITQILSGGQFTTHNTQTNYIKNYEFDYPQSHSLFTITCVSGHITSHDFYENHRKWNSCEPFDLFDAPVDVRIAPDKKFIEQNLLTQAKRADMLMIWTDCDREGEHIGMEITKVCRKAKPGIQVKRARFSAIIAQQIHHAAQHPVELDKRQADAVEARILLDLKVGAAFTRLQTLALQGRVKEIADEKNIISYGPCQFPTLGFVVQRFNLVKAFRSELFWYIYLSLTLPSVSQCEEICFNWKRHHLFSQAVVIEIYTMMMENPIAKITKVTNRTTKKWKPLPLTTVELQKAASRLLKLAPKKALDVAEKLYQKGFISYPRTETDQFDPKFDHNTLIAKQTSDPSWGAFASSLQQEGYMPPRKGKNDDKAHPPIHPTAYANGLTGDEKRVYEYITRRYLACCSKDAEGWQTIVDVICGGEEFSATGLVVKEKNYLNVYVYDKWAGNTLPEFREGEEFEPTFCEIRQGETSKPSYLTEADLVTLMDKNGIGTDATIAQHIQTIIDRTYVIERMEGTTKYLVPSTLGIGLIEGYNQMGLVKSVSKPSLRRETERRMVQVCEGTTTKQAMLQLSLDQYKEMFVIVKRQFEMVTASVQRYLSGQGDNGGSGGNNGNSGGDGPQGGNGGFDEPGDAGQGGRGRVRGKGRAHCRSRGTSSSRATTRARNDSGPGRGRGTAARDIINDSDNGFDLNSGNSTKPATSLLHETGTSWTVESSLLTLAVPERPSEPITISSNWQARIMPVTSSSMSNLPSTSHGTSTPECECGVSAVRKTVNQGISKGKQYWGCPIQDDGCGYFKYINESQHDSEVSSDTTNLPFKRSYSSTTDSSSMATHVATRRCLCGECAVLHTVFKESSNKGRKFWKCGKGDGSPCKFFEWDDEPPHSQTRGNWAGTGLKSTGAVNDQGDDSGADACFKCQQKGHWAKECPNETSSSMRSRSFGTNAKNNATSDAKCFKCQEIGHYANACPSNSHNGGKAKAYAGSGAASSTDECFKCGKTGHWSSKCPGSGSSTASKKSNFKRGKSAGPSGSRGSRKKSAFGAADEW